MRKTAPMNALMTILAVLSCAPCALAAQPPSPASDDTAVKAPESGVTRQIDCKGRDLTVTGDNDQLTVSNCVTINVVGDHNRMTARMLPTSSIAALGNNNHIVFIHAPGFDVPVRSSGVGNEIVPDMGRDLHFTSPVKFPLSGPQH
jgi:hypothetical protein